MYKDHRVIDTHCHIYPQKIAARAVEAIGDFYLYPPYTAGDCDTVCAAEEKGGVDLTLASSVATTAHQVHSINRFIASEAASRKGRLAGLGALHPASDTPEADVEEILALGLHGVKLHPDFQKIAVDDPRMMRLYELCEGRLPILFHTGDRRYDFSNAKRLLRVLERFPKLTVVGAHFASYTVWEQAEELFGVPNLWVDCSSSLPFLSKDRAAALIEGFGAERVLFGSDCPMEDPANVLKSLTELVSDEEKLEAILHRNAERVFGL